MAYNNPQARGIYCIETVWEEDPDTPGTSTVRGILDVIRSNCGARYLHRDAMTTTEFHYYLTEWERAFAHDYPILYLGFHGSKNGKIWFKTIDGNPDLVNHEVIQARLQGGCRNRAIHFGACSALVDFNTKEFLQCTGAVAVSGYETDMDWMLSTAFDLLFLEEMQYHGQKGLTRNVASQAKRNLMADDQPYAQLRKHLGFHMSVPRPRST